MIQTEIKDNIIHTWSDLGMKIHGGFPETDYDEAYDPVDSGRTYIEVEGPGPDEDAEENDYIKALENLGVDLNEEE